MFYTFQNWFNWKKKALRLKSKITEISPWKDSRRTTSEKFFWKDVRLWTKEIPWEGRQKFKKARNVININKLFSKYTNMFNWLDIEEFLNTERERERDLSEKNIVKYPLRIWKKIEHWPAISPRRLALYEARWKDLCTPHFAK